MFRCIYLFSLAFIVTVPIVEAETRSEIDDSLLVTESELLGEIPMVFSASRLPQPQNEAPASVTIIDAAMIKASGVRNIPDILKLAPGFIVGYEFGHLPNVTYHGLGDQFTRRLQILVDGRPAYSAFFSGSYWQNIPVAIDDIERIEIIRGPNSVTYGSNAATAVINIITTHPSQHENSYFRISGGDHNIKDAVLRKNFHTEKSDIRLTYQHKQDRLFDGRPDTHNVNFISARSDTKLTNKDNIEVILDVGKTDRQYGEIGGISNPAHDVEDTYNSQSIKWNRILANNDEINIKFTHHYEKREQQYFIGPFDLGPPINETTLHIDANHREERYYLEFENLVTFSDQLRAAWGVGYRIDRARSDGWLGSTDWFQHDVASIFINSQWRINKNNIIDVGVMAEDSSDFGTEYSPRLAYLYHINNETTIRAGVSSAVRAPSILEQNFDVNLVAENVLIRNSIHSPEQLKSERITTYDLALINEIPKYHFAWDIRLFQDEMKDLVSFYDDPEPAALNPDRDALGNNAEAKIKGVELQFKYKPASSNQLACSLTYLDAEGLDRVNADLDGELEQSVPENTTSCLITYSPITSWDFGIFYHYMSGILWLSNGERVPSYDRTDISISKSFKLANKASNLSLVVQNIGSDYADFRNDNLFDTLYYLSFSMEL